MRKVITVLIAIALVFAFASCGGDQPVPTGFAPNQTTEAYAYVHGGYVGQAVVSTDAEGALSVTLDEAFLPHTLAEVDIESDEWTEENTATFEQRGTNHVAKYVIYDGTTYVAETVGGAVIWVQANEDGSPGAGPGLEKEILRNQNTMRAWFESVGNGAFQILTEFGGTPQTITESPYGGMYKSDGGYWPAGITSMSWAENMEAIENAAINLGTGFTLDDMGFGDNGFTLADATTGATARDAVDYFNLIQNAVGRLAWQ